jgi:single-strand DNA-binding protein
MAGSVNKVMLIGNLGKDPEVRYLDNERAVANFSIATSESYTDRQGQKVTNTEWHAIELWDGLAKVAEQYLHKGDSVFIEGQLKTEKWTSKDTNEPKSRVIIRARSMQMLSTKNAAAGSSNSDGNQGDDDIISKEFSKSNQEQDDDLPF